MPAWLTQIIWLTWPEQVSDRFRHPIQLARKLRIAELTCIVVMCHAHGLGAEDRAASQCAPSPTQALLERPAGKRGTCFQGASWAGDMIASVLVVEFANGEMV